MTQAQFSMACNCFMVAVLVGAWLWIGSLPENFESKPRRRR
jgi:hypothetical protein